MAEYASDARSFRATPRRFWSLYYPEFLTGFQQQETIVRIDSLPWRNDLERRVQHYGWRYDYRARTVSRDMHIGPLPDWLQKMAVRLTDKTGLFDRVPDQVIVNEYLPGQGIALHIDRQCFGPAVATVSLGDTWRMELRPAANEAGKPEHVLLEVGSALVMTGSARFRWLHGIAKRKRGTDRGALAAPETSDFPYVSNGSIACTLASRP